MKRSALVVVVLASGCGPPVATSPISTPPPTVNNPTAFGVAEPEPEPSPIGESPEQIVDAPAASNRSNGVYETCDITNGQVFSCAGWYQGETAVLEDEVYQRCDITNGRVFSCGGWYQGKAVIFRDNAYRECDITNGRVFSCGGWYQGTTAVLKTS